MLQSQCSVSIRELHGDGDDGMTAGNRGDPAVTGSNFEKKHRGSNGSGVKTSGNTVGLGSKCMVITAVSGDRQYAINNLLSFTKYTVGLL
jgi:hypothetical protein